MKKIILIILLAILLACPALKLSTAGVIEEDLPPERSKKEKVYDSTNTATFDGYLNSNDVMIAGGILTSVYHFCKKAKSDYCADEDGVLVITGAETGKIPETIQLLDSVNGTNTKIYIRFSTDDPIFGVKRIIDVITSNDSI